MERPSAFEVASSTLLSVETWPLVEGQVANASAADREDIRRSACATEWQDTLVKRRAPEVLKRAAGDRLVEGEPMVVQVADNGRFMQNTMRNIGKKHNKNTPKGK